MTLPIRFRRAVRLALLALVPAAGCRPSAIYVPAVRMQATVEPMSLAAGDTARLVFTVTNPQPDTVVLEFGEACRVHFSVRDQAGRVVDGDPEMCLAPGGGLLTLAPGASWQAAGDWTPSRAGREPLAPGTYIIASGLAEHFSISRGKRDWKMGGGPDRMSVNVLPPEAP